MKFSVRFVVIAVLLGVVLCAFTAAFASAPKTACKWRLKQDFENIHDLAPLDKDELSRYRTLKADVADALAECPRDVYPVSIPAWYPLTYLDFAILAQDDQRVAKAIHSKQNIIRNDAGQTPLHFAAYYGSVKILGILLDSGLAIDAQNKLGYTPLMAAPGGVELNGENVKFLVEHGADIWHVTKHGITPLTAAIIARDVPAVRFLLRNGALTKRVAGEVSPELVAKKLGYDQILDMLKRCQQRKNKNEQSKGR